MFVSSRSIYEHAFRTALAAGARNRKSVGAHVRIIWTLTEVNGELFIPRGLESDKRLLRRHRLGHQGCEQAKGTHLWGAVLIKDTHNSG
jgi:hypothetical protein